MKLILLTLILGMPLGITACASDSLRNEQIEQDAMQQRSTMPQRPYDRSPYRFGQPMPPSGPPTPFSGMERDAGGRDRQGRPLRECLPGMVYC